ncbi:hypothetical protein [Pontixanthobacter sp. CEM42]|uniref:hypothetical protein n=1 Tax=Pontixanthobacter sp. CEM42 TaxID=2792077 RepID=UPI001AE0E036|nr:hypothetical protein [Pontixanthobacter sp. CEM42]
MDNLLIMRISGEVRRGWKAYAVLAALVIAIVAAFQWREQQRAGHWIAVDAKIIGFGTAALAQSYRPNQTLMSFETANGVVGAIHVTNDRVRDCEVGDSVLVEKQGITFRLAQASCGKR